VAASKLLRELFSVYILKYKIVSLKIKKEEKEMQKLNTSKVVTLEFDWTKKKIKFFIFF
jgi:hypothetical protein